MLAALLGLTLAVEAWQVRSATAADVEQAQAETVAEVRAELAAVVEAMQTRAAAVAQRPEVAAALEGSTDGVDAEVLQTLAQLRRPSRTSVEILSRDGAIVAWSGPAFPRLATPPVDSSRTLVVADDAGRRALVVWAPVPGAVTGEPARGAVRVVRLVQAAVPVRNRYLQDYDIADEWRERASTCRSPSALARAAATTLRGPDGTVLGRVARRADRRRARGAGSVTRRAPSPRCGARCWCCGCWRAWRARPSRRSVRPRPAQRRALDRAAARSRRSLGGLVALRYGLLALDVPVRWLDRARRTAALFDPSYLALRRRRRRCSAHPATSRSRPRSCSSRRGGARVRAALDAGARRGAPGRGRGARGRRHGGGARWARALDRQSVLDATIAYTDHDRLALDGPDAGRAGGTAGACWRRRWRRRGGDGGGAGGRGPPWTGRFPSCSRWRRPSRWRCRRRCRSAARAAD